MLFNIDLKDNLYQINLIKIEIEQISKIIKDIDYIASNYKSESEISQINMNYSQYQFISKDLFKILKVAKEVENLSNGYYNIMLGKVSSSLGFAPDFGKKTLHVSCRITL